MRKSYWAERGITERERERRGGRQVACARGASRFSAGLSKDPDAAGVRCNYSSLRRAARECREIERENGDDMVGTKGEGGVY